jgi:hypothetical protein
LPRDPSTVVEQGGESAVVEQGGNFREITIKKLFFVEYLLNKITF